MMRPESLPGNCLMQSNCRRVFQEGRSDCPYVNGQFIMLNNRIQTNQILTVFLAFQNQDNSCPLAGMRCIVQCLPDSFSPFDSEVEFYCVGASYAVAPGFILQDIFHLALFLMTPSFLIPFFRMQVTSKTRRTDTDQYQENRTSGIN